jgi:hypothetical protein
MTKKTAGIIFIYCAAFAIMLSILFLFKVIRFRFAYTTAAGGFLLYIIGLFLTREGKLSPYKIAMVVLSFILIGVAVIREVFHIF